MDYLSAAEFLHVGSLVIDDIQDESNTRRGGPSAHLMYGIPTAINSGTYAYFSIYYAIAGLKVTPEVRNLVYKEFFLTMRAGHLGQALDINGLDHLMDAVIESSNGELIRSRVLATHRLKTAAPAGSLARTGVYVGNGTEAQADAIGHYFESVGTAFQIMDDVLNLRGLITNVRTPLDLAWRASCDGCCGGAHAADCRQEGWCCTEGPWRGHQGWQGDVPRRAGGVAPAQGRDEEAVGDGAWGHLWQWRKLWCLLTFPRLRRACVCCAQIKSKPEDQSVINACIAKMEECGAIQACVDEAMTIVEDAWRKLDPIVPDSFYKIMLRAFGWFVVERKI